MKLPRFLRRDREIGTFGDALAQAAMWPFRQALGARLRVARRNRRTVVEEIGGIPIIVLPDVFNPVLFHTGRMLAEAVRRELDRRGPGSEQTVLDLGTGSGVGAVFAGLKGARVVAVDVNPQAIRCARLNAQLHHLEDRIDVREGDLFEPVEGERFDLVLFNPPLYHGQPTTFLEAAWRSEDCLVRFAEQIRNHLEPGGRALVVLSTEGDCEGVLWRLRASGLLLEQIGKERWMGDVLVVVRAEKP